MKKYILILMAVMVMLISGCHSYYNTFKPAGQQAVALSGTGASVENEIPDAILAVYVSNEASEQAVKQICEETKADTLELSLEQEPILDLSNYGTIFLVFSMHSGELPEEVTYFLMLDKLKGKTVIPACMTSGIDEETLKRMIIEHISEIELIEAFVVPIEGTLTQDISTRLSDMRYYQ